jgi:hypothetical protein
MCYNNTPKRYGCYATEYYNHIPRYDKDISRYENVTGEKPDVSHFVPFYAQGVCHETQSQRELHGGATFTLKAKTCRMLGYSS